MFGAERCDGGLTHSFRTQRHRSNSIGLADEKVQSLL